MSFDIKEIVQNNIITRALRKTHRINKKIGYGNLVFGGVILAFTVEQ